MSQLDLQNSKKIDGKVKWETLPLSSCLKKFLDDVSEAEIVSLQKFESMDVSARSPLMERPIKPNACTKAVAVQVKHLLPLYDKQIGLMTKHFKDCVKKQISYMMGASGIEYHEQIVRLFC
jgi:hypothetical protein